MSSPSVLDQVLIKKPHRQESYKSQELKEFAECANPVTGPLYFLTHFFYIQHPIRGKMLYAPYDYQVRLIATYHNYRFNINMLPRQMGKTATAAGYLLWYAMFVPDSTILVAAHKYLGAQEIMQRIRYAYEMCPNHIRAGVTSYNKGSIEFENGSRIVSQATTENTGRGMSITLLYCDEFSFVRPTIAQEFWTSISPTLSTGGKAILTSTPNSDEDQFAMIWNAANQCTDEYGNETDVGRNGFKAFRAYWNEHPDRDETWAAEQRAQLGEERFRREMECEFIRDEETLINPLFLSTMEGQAPINKTGQIRWYKNIDKNSTYLVSLDPSIGTGGDPAAIEVFELPSCEQVAEWCHNKTPVEKQIKILAEIVEMIAETVKDPTRIYYSLENNTVGEAGLVALRDYGEENIPGLMMSEPLKKGSARQHRKGFTTSKMNKLSACAKLKQLVESQKLLIKSKTLVSELKNFIATGGSYKAKLGETDDLVMATLIAVRMLVHLQNYDPELDARLRDQDNLEDLILPMPFIIM
jgi:hypothetical protein